MRSLPTDEAIATRRSVRAFLPVPVARATVETLLAAAARAPSGSNIQPWKVRVVAGEVRDRLVRAVLAADEAEGTAVHKREWNYYPVNWREPYLGRRRKVGFDLYGLMGISRRDLAGMAAQRRRNYEFFGAPVGLVFTLDEDLEIGSWLDLGIFIGTFVVAARGMGLDTCPQAAFADFHAVLRRELGIPQNEIVICGMALGHADPAAPENRLVTERATPAEFATFEGFPPA